MRLKQYLLKKGISQRSFANSVGVSGVHINHIINGRRNPSPKLMKKIKEISKDALSFEDLCNPNIPSRKKRKK